MQFKKPNFWDYKKPNWISKLLFPFTILLKINNFYINNKKLFKSDKIKSICIGNIYVGGTGKTPLTEKIYKMLVSLNYKTTTFKKYYPNQIDEQLILKKNTNFLTYKSRKKGLVEAIKKKYQVILFDDGLQDKEIDYDLKFVCFNRETWVGNNCLIPAGPMREKLNSLKKFDAVFLNGEKKNLNLIIKSIIKYNPKIKIFTTSYSIKNTRKFNKKFKYLIFSGLGNPANFKNLLSKYKFKIYKEILFPDHYRYNEKDIIKILDEAKNNNLKIITTEKDYVKLPNIYKDRIGCININLKIDNEKNLINLIKKKI